MIFEWAPSPIAFAWGSQSIRVYSLLLLLAQFGGYLIFRYYVKRDGGDPEDAADFLPYGMLLPLVGARIGQFVFYEPDRLLADPVSVLQIWRGGLASHGALLGMTLALWLFARKRRLPLLAIADRLAVAGPLAVICVRIGNLFNSEILGIPTDGTWGIQFVNVDGDLLLPRHPVQLYEIAIALGILLGLVLLERKWRPGSRPLGLMTGIFLTAYSAGRFVVDFWKEREFLDLDWPLSMSQVLGLITLAIGLLLLWRAMRKRESSAWPVHATAVAAERLPA
jgi:prolipoprotein diacylglyceryl transferase